MAGITGLGTTFNLPNYHGELFAVSPSDTPLLSAAGGLGQGGQVSDTLVEWQKYDLRTPAVRTRLEGADAPTAESRVRANVTNRLQIFQEAVSTSYTKQAATERYAALAGGVGNPVQNEHSWQVMQSLKQIARDVNYSFWHAVRNDPSDNTTARQMAGLLSVISTNAKVRSGSALTSSASAATDTITATHDLAAGDQVVFTDVGASTTIVTGRAYTVKSVSTTVSFKIVAGDDVSATAITVGTATVSFYAVNAANTVTTDNVNRLLQSAYDNGGITNEATATLFVPSGQKLRLTSAYAAAYGQADPLSGTRNVGGVAVNTIVTDFGTLNVKIDRMLPADAIAVVSLEQIQPVFLSIPGKGVLFEEELAKTGASEKSQLYGEIGLAYGNEATHAVMRGLFA
jgi:hypothetical protein